jgi:hypothetical protein
MILVPAFRRFAMALCLLSSFSACRAHDMDPAATTSTAAATAPSQSVGDALFAKVRSLIGTWDAPMKNGTMTDVFKPFAFDTAILGEEWLNGKQITSTIFYVVNGELRADHYCDYKNQPRYTAVPAPDPNVLDFEFRDATNLDTHPVHFHYTRWQLVDEQHLTQDWFIMGGDKPVTLAHMQFTRRPTSAADAP